MLKEFKEFIARANVIDLAAVLQRSIRETAHSRKGKNSRKGAA